jgi:hypothetical protein
MTPERVAIYTSDFYESARSGSFWLAFTLRPKRSGFLRPAQAAVLTAFLLLLGGALSEALGGRLATAEVGSADAAIAVLLVVPSVISAYLANRGEHELLSELLRLPRLGVALASFTTLLAGGALVIGFSGRVLAWSWFIAAGIGLLVLVQLCVMTWQSGNSERDVIRDSVRTKELRVLVLVN